MTSVRVSWSIVVALGIALAVSVAALESPAQPSRGEHSQGSLLKERLGLTDEQMNSIQEIYRREARAGTQSRLALRQAERELRRLVLAGGGDAAVQAKTAEVKDLLGATVDARTKTLREIAAVLTPEQRVTYATLGEPVQGEMRPGLR